MISKIKKLPDDVGKLKEIVAHNEAHITILNGRIALLESRLFGPRNEKLKALNAQLEAAGQQSLFDLLDEHPDPIVEEPEVETTEVPAHARKKRGRKPLPSNLPREEVIHDISEEEKTCACGCLLTRIGEEKSEQLHIEPAKLKVIVNVRPKYACKKCEGTSDENRPTVRIAPVPPQIIPKSFATPSLLTCIIIAKFADSLPLYRQEKQFSRIGIDLPRATMANWLIRVADRCLPLLSLLRQEVRSGPLINADETTLQVMKEPDRANTKKSYAWIFRGGTKDKPAVIFKYHPTRAGRVARDFLAGYKGYVQCDGYTGYNALEQVDGVTLCGCWAHARRKFVEVAKIDKAAKESGNMRACDIALKYISRLYAVEHEAKDKNLKHEDLYLLRQEKSKPILDDFGLWLRQTAPKVPPQSSLGKAITYTLNQWQRLIVYIEDGHLRPDNNAAENAIRPFVIGRKNWLFSGSPEGADTSAALYSLVETAKLNKLDPYKYLLYLLEKIPVTNKENFKELLPTHITRDQIDNFLATT